MSYAQPNYYNPRGFVSQNGKMRDIGTFWSDAINGRGQIIGHDIAGHAFLWQNGKLTDLGLSLDHGLSAASTLINDRGQIVGTRATNGTTHFGAVGEREAD